MNLLQRKPGRTIRAAARNELRRSKTLWKEYKKLRRGWLHLTLNEIHPSFALVFFFVILTLRGATAERALLILALYSTGTVFVRAYSLFHGLYRSFDLAFFMYMPVSGLDFFSYQWRKFLRSSAWDLICFVAVYGYAASLAGSGKNLWLAVLAASLIQWLTVLSLALLIVVFRPSWGSRTIAAFFYISSCVTVFVSNQITGLIEKVLLPLPSAWTAQIFKNGILLRNTSALPWLIPTLPLLFAIPSTFQKLRKQYIPLLETPPPVTELLAEEEAEEPASPAPTQDAAKSTAPNTAGALEQFSALAVDDWEKSGWMGRIFERMLNSREKTVAEFMLAGSIRQWTKQWQIAGVLFAAGVAATLFIHTPYVIVHLGPCLLGAMFGMPLLGGSWPGFQGWYSAGKFMPIYSGFPAGYGETSRIIFKASVLRIVSCFPFVLVSSVVLGKRILGSENQGMLLASEFVFLLLIVQPIAVLLKYSQGTTDSRVMNLHIFACFLAALLPGALLLGSIICVFALSGWFKMIAAVGALAGSTMIWGLYKVLYERGRIDLLRSPNK